MHADVGHAEWQLHGRQLRRQLGCGEAVTDTQPGEPIGLERNSQHNADNFGEAPDQLRPFDPVSASDELNVCLVKVSTIRR